MSEFRTNTVRDVPLLPGNNHPKVMRPVLELSHIYVLGTLFEDIQQFLVLTSLFWSGPHGLVR